MPPYITRSVARKQALEPYKKAIVPPSPTGKGSHIRRSQPSDDEVPALTASNTLESEPSFDRPITPDQVEVEEFKRSPTACSVELSDESSSSIVTDDRHNVADRALAERMLADLQQQKRLNEERLERHRGLQSKLNRFVNPRANEIARSHSGPKLPTGVTGFGHRTGTWVVEDDVWRPDFTPSTNQLPSIREIGEEVQETQEARQVQEVRNLPLNKVIQQDLSRGGVFRALTPLPSFVSGGGAMQTR